MITIISTFGKKNNTAITRRCDHISNMLGLEFSVAAIQFRLPCQFSFTNISLHKKNKAEINIYKAILKLNLFALLKKQNPLKAFILSDISVDLGKATAAEGLNSSKAHTGQASAPLPKISYHHYRALFRYFHRIFKVLPPYLQINNCTINICVARKNIQLSFPSIQLNNDQFTCYIKAASAIQPYPLNGSIDRKEKVLRINQDKQQHATPIPLPIYTDEGLHKYALCIPHQEMHVALKQDSLQVHGNFIKPYIVGQQNEISPITGISFKLDCLLTRGAFTVSPASHFSFDSVQIHFSGEHNFAQHLLQLSARASNLGGDLLRKFPFLQESKLTALPITGTMNAAVEFTMNLNNPWVHHFHLDVNTEKLSIAGPLPEWTYINAPFIHYIRQNATSLKAITLHPDASNFTALKILPATFIHTLILSEDTHFHYHHGFDSIAFGYGIVQNLLARRFVRGSSTITMQLVRNLFLHHRKSIFRKLEEIALSILLEKVLLISKERILEIYLNIIEFGPGIFGIQEACEFYFSKKPMDLTIQEMILLTYIIPRPKFFITAYEDASAQLQQNLHKHMQYMTNKMQQYGIISSAEAAMVSNSVNIRGKEMLLG
ncbi:biosynthetic peptidoglycan transglycosylase [Chitinophaga sp. Hz27]|uniref:biosynthetic peptidoglycan transglycosylase n=1 Tax=Chitinophaga sp. Hz27 TaxID=3347169 RepID=UPI0035DDD82F